MADKTCTCRRSPPHPNLVTTIERFDPNCHFHGWKASTLTTEDEDYETNAEHNERKMPW